MSDPITKQKSYWKMRPDGTYVRNVGDGKLFALVGTPENEGEWHLSISFRDNKGELSRYPRWDEIIHCRETLIPDDVNMVMILPALDDYVAMHKTTFHLHGIAVDQL